ncbi:hypothetical protein Ccrd_012793 [Cynara cardunculus var. scolymus]|uniref:Uncharacterized protein n=1 Tax=Cynara cardunculus var. scolymus TaxID=59895 RepID=A0A124SH92_CYNCS|nr:hypothetical protein Ccrd_012793 [Cynara cardunculus var. scolymus]
MGTREKDRDLERLIPVTRSGISEIDGDSNSSSPAESPPGASSSSSHQSGKEAVVKVVRSWASKKFMTGWHPSVGEYALGFITSTVILRKNTGAEELCCIYVPTNHLYLGDIVLVNSKDVMKPNISVREGIEIVISGGMSIPNILTTMDSQSILAPRSGKYVVPQV